MAAAVNLSLSSEQAALLLPLLKQLSDRQIATSRGGGYEISNSPPSSSPDTGHFAPASSSDFTADELLQKKKRNRKSTSAQSFLLYVVREAAKTAGLWDKCPYMDDISPQSLQLYYNHVYTMCPSLKEHSEKELRRRLSDSLMNRRAHLRAKKVLSTSPRKKRKKARMACAFAPTIQASDTDTSDLSPGSEVEVMNASRKLIGVGLYLGNYDVDGPEPFGRVILTRCSQCDDGTELYYPVQGKTSFCDLQKDDIFVWKKRFLKKTEASRKITSDRRNREGSGVLQASSHYSSSEDAERSLSSDSDSSDSRGVLSQYELERLERIQENQAVLKELLNDGVLQSETVKSVSDVTCKLSKKSKIASEPTKLTKTPAKSKVVSESTKPVSTKPVSTKPVSTKRSKTPKSVPKTPKKSKSIAESEVETSKAKRSKFWEYVTDDDEEPDMFQSTILSGKRKRKPKQLMTI